MKTQYTTYMIMSGLFAAAAAFTVAAYAQLAMTPTINGIGPAEIHDLAGPRVTSSGGLPTIMHAQYPADFRDDRILMGASHNVFVGKVISQVGNIPERILPDTQFSVDVIFNVKGNLRGRVTVDQNGGYKDGHLYLIENSAPCSSLATHTCSPPATATRITGTP